MKLYLRQTMLLTFVNFTFIFRHGLGDTYNKIFCDPKLPFADCATKWYASHKGMKTDTQKMSSDEDERNNSEESASETRMSLRRSKRTSNVDRDNEEDTDALSELETLAKLGRIEGSLSTDYWFTERALETRLHHIAHAVQNREWPVTIGSMGKSEIGRSGQPESSDERKHPQKRHIAIDVETDRAKLHALLSSPVAAHCGPRDDASSDSGSRRSTPAPPPAHQRVAPSPAPAAVPSPSPSHAATTLAAPVDLSAPLDLSEAQDFSMGRRTPQTDATSSSTPSRSRLDDTLTRLMKRKNAVSINLNIHKKFKNPWHKKHKLPLKSKK